MFFLRVRIVLIFCIAGLLFIVLRARLTLGASVSHPAGDRPYSSHLISRWLPIVNEEKRIPATAAARGVFSFRRSSSVRSILAANVHQAPRGEIGRLPLERRPRD